MADAVAPFADRLIEAQERKRSLVIAGLDPHPSLLPPSLVTAALESSSSPREGACRAFREFCFQVLEAVEAEVVAVKPQIAFFELLGGPGITVFEEVAQRARELGLLVIGDLKRGDIGSTADAYARAWLGGAELDGHALPAPSLDALTVNPYLGSDGIRPFVDRAAATGSGLFVLVRTSNPSSAELQELECGPRGERLFERVGDLVESWGRDLVGESGFSSVGAVVGATFPASLAALRERLPAVPFLLPGYGTQGGGPDGVAAGLDDRGQGAWVNASRSILFAYRQSPQEVDWRDASRRAARAMREELWEIRARRKRLG